MEAGSGSNMERREWERERECAWWCILSGQRNAGVCEFSPMEKCDGHAALTCSPLADVTPNQQR